jgi:hypothetical protein
MEVKYSLKTLKFLGDKLVFPDAQPDNLEGYWSFDDSKVTHMSEFLTERVLTTQDISYTLMRI